VGNLRTEKMAGSTPVRVRTSAGGGTLPKAGPIPQAPSIANEIPHVFLEPRGPQQEESTQSVVEISRIASNLLKEERRVSLVLYRNRGGFYKRNLHLIVGDFCVGSW